MAEPVINSTISTSSSYMLSLSDYLYNSKGIQTPNVLPFYLDLINDLGQPSKLYSGDKEIWALKLSINPATANVNLAKIVNRSQTMTAWVEEHWGEDLDTITFQGNTAAFVVGGKNLRALSNGSGLPRAVDEGQRIRRSYNEYLGIIDPTPVLPTDAIGLTTRYRRDSVSYRELKKLMELMATNGARFERKINLPTQNEYDPTYVTDNSGVVTSRRYIRLSHNFATYWGYLESFDLTEDAGSPFKFNYTITFKAEKTVYSYLGLL